MEQFGRSSPLGATLMEDGANFSVYAKNASGLELLLFDHVEDAKPSRVIALDSVNHRTYHYWHAYVPGLHSGQLYAYRANGARDLRFDPSKALIDPYGAAVAVPRGYDRAASSRFGEPGVPIKSVLADRREYDWEGDSPLKRPFSRTVIYEMHVGAFTRHPSSGVPPERRGTFAGLIEKIPYLKSLGVTAVELLPVFAFDPHDCPAGLVNFWGYAPMSFFAPHPGYSSRRDPLGPLDEFRDMVKALHRADIEVILDVVYNHTCEGDARGPTICWRGLSNSQYYLLEPDGNYANYSGCGNTFNAGVAPVRRMIVDSLRYWVQVMHVDGFRFDLASILSRDERGRPLENPPVLWDIESDPVLAGTKLIAEAWDAAGLYQVGTFVGDSWMEWNGRFRDDVRSFIKGDEGTVRRLAQRMMGSPDIFAHENREVEQSINFVTCHDGFTLADLVSYNEKHNEANNEQNRDGSNDNHSWNCGVEGPSTDSAVDALRLRQIKNLTVLNLLALGTPMLLMGDEVRRTQGGNNNAYCHDDERAWFDWNLVERNAELLRFCRELISWRVSRRCLAPAGLTLTELLQQASIEWHGTHLHQPDWGESSHSLAYVLRTPGLGPALLVIANAWYEPLDFELPAGDWRVFVDTCALSPNDVRVDGRIVRETYGVGPRSVVVMIKAS